MVDTDAAARVVLLVTTDGIIGIELYDTIAPQTCNAFWQCAVRGLYDDTVFHRLVPQFVVQGGRLSTEGQNEGGDANCGGVDAELTGPDEIDQRLRHTGAGVVSAVNLGYPNSNTSQFFITLSPQPRLDGRNTIFGRVCRGMSAVAAISKQSVDTATFEPLNPTRIIRCEGKTLPKALRPLHLQLWTSDLHATKPAGAAARGPQVKRPREGRQALKAIVDAYAESAV